jgi:hypothetical protein
MTKKKYHEKYTLEGSSPLARVTFLIPKTQYQKLIEFKEEDGTPINFFVQRAIEKAIEEKEKRKILIEKALKEKR